MPNTINLRLLDNKNIVAELNVIPLAQENSYKIIAGEENATIFKIASKPNQYKSAQYTVEMVNSQGYGVEVGNLVEKNPNEYIIENDEFILPTGMAVAGYGWVQIRAYQGVEVVPFMPLKVKVWNTLPNWKDHISEGGGGEVNITIDSELSNTSTNPVQNKVVKQAIELAKTEAKNWGTSQATAVRNEAEVYTDQKFNGANKAVAFTNYSALCTALNNDNQAPQYSVGQNIYIQTLNVPDLWVRNVSEMYNYYIYNTDEDFINKLNEKGYVQVGFYLLSALETQKVDLIDYAKTEYVDEKAATAIVTAENNAKEYTDQKIGDIERTLDGIIGDISTALDELHTYARSLINGGVSQ